MRWHNPPLERTAAAVYFTCGRASRVRRGRSTALRYVGTAMIAALRRFFDPLKNTVEALQWLRTNRNDGALAGNRFDTTEAAIAFVQSLYDAGAETVAIPTKRIFNEAWRIEQEGGPYAETLLVKLPKDPEKRRAVWQICELEYARELGEEWERSPEDYTPSPGIVDLWWD